MAWRFCKADVPWDHRPINQTPKMLMELLRNLIGQRIPGIIKGPKNALYSQRRIDRLGDGINRFHQGGQSFKREILALHGNQHGVRRHERVECQHIERRRAVDNHKIVQGFAGLQRCLQPLLTIF